MEDELERFDFSNVQTRRKNMLDSCGAMDFDSYTFQFRTLGDQMMEAVCAAANLPRAPYLELQRSKTDPQTIVGIPRSQSGPATVAINWTEKGETAHIDLSLLLAVHPFHIPHGSRAFIPVEQANLRTLGPCIVFRFGKAKFKPIESTKNQASSGQPSPANAEAAAAADKTNA